MLDLQDFLVSSQIVNHESAISRVFESQQVLAPIQGNQLGIKNLHCLGATVRHYLRYFCKPSQVVSFDLMATFA